MTAITAELAPERDVTYGRSPVSHFATDAWVLTKRSIARIRREPETLAAGADVEAAIVAVKPYAAGSVQPDEDGRRLSVPVAAAEGLTTRVVRALDQAGIPVNDVTMQRASLDDVFLSLTGHVTAPAEDTSDDEEGSVAA